MGSSITVHKATAHCAIVQAIDPQNTQAVPVQAKNKPKGIISLAHLNES
jgi:hypothetical protein